MSETRPDIMEPKEWRKILENIVASENFKSQIKNHGYYLSPEYTDFRTYLKKEWNLNSTINTANFLSKDFWHEQSRILTDQNYYLIRAGRGSFVILDQKQFPRPYLDLNIENAIEIPVEEPEGFDNLKKAFNDNILENAGLEQLRFNGGYDKVIERTLGSRQENYIGIRGNTTRIFDIFLRKANSQDPQKIKTYRGQAELDYTIWTRNSVFLFEAKQVKQGSIEYYLDIGWHKFAYAGIRFLNYQNLHVYPIYFLRLKNMVFLFVFPHLNFYERGIILNDSKQMTPEKIFSITLS